MPRYYCDYCDTYLTHDSPSVRKQHNAGYKHKSNVRTYYQQFEEQQTQSLIDQRIKEHLGQAAAFQQVGANFHRLTSLPSQGPHIPILPTPILPIPGSQPRAPPFLPGIRPPVFARPPGAAPGYGAGPFGPGMQQMNGLPMPPPPMINPSSIVGTTAPTSGSAPPPALSPSMYQEGPTPTSAGYNAYQVPPSMGPAATTSQDDS